MSSGGDEQDRDFVDEVLRSMPHGVLAWGPDGRCLIVNDAALHLLDRPKEQLLTLGSEDLPNLLDRSTDPEAAGRLREALETSSAISSLPIVLNRPSRPLPVRADISRPPGGGCVLILADLPEAPSREDIFERTVLEFYEHTPDPVVVHRRGALLYANPPTLRALGYERLDEIEGRPVLELVHPDDREEVAARIGAMVTRGAAVPIREERFLRKDGGVMTALVAALPLPYHGQGAVTVIGHDVSELKRVEAEMEAMAGRARQQAAELQAVLDNMLDNVVMCDAGMGIRLLNQAARRLFGLQAGSDVEVDLRLLFEKFEVRDSHGERHDYTQMPLVRALRGEVVERADMVMRSPGLGRDVWLRVSSAPIHDQAGEIVAAVAVARDVTDLIELDRLKDQFIRVAAHELKTPVSIIKGYVLTLLGSGAQLPPPLRRTLDAIARGSDRIDRIVTGLVDISQVELHELELRRESADLSELVQKSVDRVSLAQQTQRIHVVSSPPLVAQVDRDRFEQVVEGLLGNALSYSPETSEVEVELRRVDGSAEVLVRDRGIGIPRGKQAHIFERFFRAHTDTPYDYGGMGVGLHIARVIAEAHGGQIRFESEEGVGSTFYLTLPLAPENGP